MNRGLEAMGGRLVKRWRVYERLLEPGRRRRRRRPPSRPDARAPAIMAPMTVNFGSILTAMVTPFDERGRGRRGRGGRR